MFYTCSPDCTDPRHQHGPARSAAARVAATTAKASARPVARSRSGKSRVVDLHCHYLNPEVNAKTVHLNAAQHDPTVIFANELTRETNVKQMKTRAPKLTGVAERLGNVRDLRLQRMGFAPTTCPTTPALEDLFYPDARRIAAAARDMVEGRATGWMPAERNDLKSITFRGPF